MQLTIDNLDGAGPVDYSASIAADVPLKIERVLNRPTICSGLLEMGPLSIPARRGRVVLAAANGTLLFTGYLAIEPAGIYAGVASAGPVYRYAFSAISDEWLLDKQVPPLIGASLAAAAGAALTSLTQRVDAGAIATGGLSNSRAVGVFEPSQAEAWSSNAGALAAAAYSAYRVVDGALTLEPAGTVTHALNFDAGTDASGGAIAIAALKSGAVKELANDVTLSGAIEPAAYIGETFAGDGTTTIFQLTDAPFQPAASLRKLLDDDFNEQSIDAQIWAIGDPGSHLSITAGGLTMNGGNGFAGQTTLLALDSVEMGGSLLLEAAGVTLSGASTGTLCGLYTGPVSTANCFAGYSVTQSGGSISLTPLIAGAAAGASFSVAAGHSYTLRIRLHCVEQQRVLQTYYAMADGVVEAFGGGAIPAPMTLVFDLIDLGASSNTPATILYDGSAAAPLVNTPAACTFVAVDCVQLFGSIGALSITQTGSAWVTSTPPGGSGQTRLIGIAGEGVDCTISPDGKVTFLAGRIPVAGEYVTVLYRNRQRAITRIEDTASVALETRGNGPGTSRWLGKVLRPPARSSADCESAALAILSLSTSRAAALAGSYQAVNLQQQSDVWPGDVLSITQQGATFNVVVRTVLVESSPSLPEALAYHIAFANDWAEDLGLTLSEALAADALIPRAALPTMVVAAGAVLANLQQLVLLTATTAALQIDAGVAPPSGGGFEVRRRDNNFGPAIQQDLVLRSPVRSFSIPREAQVERYFVRMYDASTPRRYSRSSSAVFLNLPVG